MFFFPEVIFYIENHTRIFRTENFKTSTIVDEISALKEYIMKAKSTENFQHCRTSIILCTRCTFRAQDTYVSVIVLRSNIV